MSYIKMHIMIFALTCKIMCAANPQLHFAYDWRGKLLDFFGQVVLQDITLSQLKKEYQDRLPLLAAAWKRESPLLFTSLEAAFNRYLTKQERTVMIYLTNNWSYGSSRILAIGLRHILTPEPWQDTCSREAIFVCTLFHELLHVWVDEHIDINRSPLLQKYRQENSNTRDHIHLIALQRMVYRNSKQRDILTFLEHCYCNLSPLSYKRAWHIVEAEGDAIVLDDIRNSLR